MRLIVVVQLKIERNCIHQALNEHTMRLTIIIRTHNLSFLAINKIPSEFTKNEPIIVRITAVGHKIVALEFFCGWCAKATASVSIVPWKWYKPLLFLSNRLSFWPNGWVLSN